MKIAEVEVLVRHATPLGRAGKGGGRVALPTRSGPGVKADEAEVRAHAAALAVD